MCADTVTESENNVYRTPLVRSASRYSAGSAIHANASSISGPEVRTLTIIDVFNAKYLSYQALGRCFTKKKYSLAARGAASAQTVQQGRAISAVTIRQVACSKHFRY